MTKRRSGNQTGTMKKIRAYLPCCLIVSGALLVSGCTTTGHDPAPVAQTFPNDGMKGIEKSPAPDPGWADSLGWVFLESLYATAVASQSH
jgi:hypothetical protein